MQVVIVGGGPAGLAAAEAAAKRGVQTLLLERQNEIGYPIHTSGGSWVSDMKALDIPDHLYHPAPNITILSPHKAIELHYDPAVACVVDVRGLYQHLATRAVAAGANVRVQHRVDKVLTEGERVVGVTYTNHLNKQEDILADVVIDTSGFARHIGIRTGLGSAFRRYGYGAEYDLYAPDYPQEQVYLMMGSTYAPSGYAWAFPHGDHRVRLGVGVIHPDSEEDARLYLDRILHEPQLQGTLKHASPIEYHTGLFPATRPMKHFSRDGLLLAGDAGGQGSTLVGEGIRFAIYAGQMAGTVAAEAVKAEDTSKAFLRRFDRQWKKRFGLQMNISYLINRTISTYTDQQWDRSINLFNALSPFQIARAIRSDFSFDLLWGILIHNPSVISTGGNLLLDQLLSQNKKKSKSSKSEKRKD